jgi:hypothetical protein
MRRLVLHIGTEKTGTTAVQTWCVRNRAALASQGVHYPIWLGRESMWPLALIAAAPAMRRKLLRERGPFGAAPPDEAEAARAAASWQQEIQWQLARLPAGFGCVVLSSEHLHSRLQSAEEVRRLHLALAPFFGEIRVLVWLRRQDEVVSGLHSTIAKGRRVLPEPLDAGAEFAGYFDYDALLARWAAGFGEAALEVRLFERARLKGGDIVSDFLDAAGIARPEGDAPPGRTNPGLDAAALGLLAAADRLPPEQQRGFRPWLVAQLEATSAGHPPWRPSRDGTAAFLARFAEGNERVRARYFPERAALFEADLSALPEREDRIAEPSPETGRALEALHAGWRSLSARAAEQAEQRTRFLGLQQTARLREERIAALDAAIARHEAAARDGREALAEAARREGALREELAAVQARCAEIDVILQRRDAQIADLDRTLRARDGRIGELDELLRERDRQLAALDVTLRDLDRRLVALDALIGERDREIGRINEAFQLREAEAAGELVRGEVQRERLAGLERQLAECRAAAEAEALAARRREEALGRELARQRAEACHQEGLRHAALAEPERAAAAWRLALGHWPEHPGALACLAEAGQEAA